MGTLPPVPIVTRLPGARPNSDTDTLADTYSHAYPYSGSASRRSILSACSYHHLSHRTRGLPGSDGRQPIRNEQSVSPYFPWRRPLLENGR